MGSCILSRSFNVTRWTGETEEEADAIEDTGPSVSGSAMNVDDSAKASVPPSEAGASESTGDGDNEDDEDDADDEEDDPSDVAMVPMADMLNARFESENVSPPRHTLYAILR